MPPKFLTHCANHPQGASSNYSEVLAQILSHGFFMKPTRTGLLRWEAAFKHFNQRHCQNVRQQKNNEKFSLPVAQNPNPFS